MERKNVIDSMFKLDDFFTSQEERDEQNKEKIEKLVVAQDIGSAIKGIVRGDYFWGSGADEILDKAGKMNSSGKYYILIPKNAEQNYEHF